MGRRPPRTEGVQTVRGVRGPVTIRRDRWHIPHIEAGSVSDAWYGLGFCQGQDRAFQLETYKRLAAGRLSEMVGPDAVDVDRLMRRLSLRRIAAEQIDDLSETARVALEAFAQGVSDGTGPLGSPRPAHEFALLRAQPSEHTAADAAATMKLMGFLLSANWQTELLRLKVVELDGSQALQRVDPVGAAHLPVTSPPGGKAGELADRLAVELALLHRWAPIAGGSNNWVLAGSKTASGSPLIGNDPHLPGRLPPFWYLAHLDTPEWSVAGAALAGAPGIVSGHNGHGAWGVTSGHCDDADLFLEEVEVEPDGTARIRVGDDWTETHLRRERIRVRGGSDVIEEVLETRHGPVISPALHGEHATSTPQLALAIRGMWRERGPVDGFLSAPGARDFEQFRGAFAHWPGISLNVVWADADGGIGWQLVGELPRRRTGYGMIPMPGWRPEVGWDGRVPFDRMPSERDPEGGVLATANNRPVPDAGQSEDAFLGVDFLDGYRLAAILDALEERDDWDVASTLRVQLDTRSTTWGELKEVLLGVDAGGDEDVSLALSLLSDWDGRVAADSAAASIYELATAELNVRVAHAAAPRSADWLLGRSPAPDLLGAALSALKISHIIELATEQPDGWFEDGWEVVLRDSLAHAVQRLRDEHGPDPDRWAWGTVRPVHLRHLLGDAATPLAGIFNRGPIAMGGDAHTIPQASPAPIDPLGDPVAIASMRAALDPADPSASRWALAGGQSGNPCSPHYDDQLTRWERGEGIPIPWTRDEVERATVATLRLLPASVPSEGS